MAHTYFTRKSTLCLRLCNDNNVWAGWDYSSRCPKIDYVGKFFDSGSPYMVPNSGRPTIVNNQAMLSNVIFRRNYTVACREIKLPTFVASESHPINASVSLLNTGSSAFWSGENARICTQFSRLNRDCRPENSSWRWDWLSSKPIQPLNGAKIKFLPLNGSFFSTRVLHQFGSQMHYPQHCSIRLPKRWANGPVLSTPYQTKLVS